MKKIIEIAKKEKNGKVKTAPLGKDHDDIHVKGKPGFEDSNGKFENRKQAASTVEKAKQTKPKDKNSLHSKDFMNKEEKKDRKELKKKIEKAKK